MLSVDLVGWTDGTTALNGTQAALEARVAALELRLNDMAHEVLAVAQQALLAPERQAEISEGSMVWDRLSGQPLVAVVETIVEVRVIGSANDSRAHRVLGWVLRDETGAYRARPAVELATVRPCAPNARRAGVNGGVLFAVLAVLAAALLALALARA